jgi:CSLREA domain-containing protein
MEFSTRHRRDHLFCRTPLARALRFETLEDRRVMAVLTVDTPLDVVNLNDGLTSLREAIFAANIVPGADEIVFDISTRAATITLSQGELKITDSLKITGPGVNLLMIDAGGSDPTPSDKKGDGSRVFNVSNGTDSVIDVEISGLYITGGDTQNLGGGILNSENLVIRNALVQGNYSINGGGIHSRGRLEVIDSIVSGNTARTGSGRDPYGGYGGGINASQLVLINSTVYQNTGRLGAGIAGTNIEIRRSEVFLNDGDGIDVSGEILIVDSTIAANKSRGIFAHMATGTITNSTISGNEAGGMFAIGGNLEIEHSTITGNAMRAGMGGGIESVGFAGAMRVHSSIIAGNIGRDVTAQTSSIVSEGYNLIGVGTAVGSFNQAGDQTGVTDPLLGPLANNGGPTRNHALLPGSPAINAGEPALVGGENGVPEFDQRGGPFTRVFGGRVDIGAFEAQSLIVDTLADENDGDYSAGDFSLREAIDLANQLIGGDTIQFDPSLSGGTILLTMGELKITDSVEIVGLGAEELTIDAQFRSRIFNIISTSGNYIFERITLQNGITRSANENSSDTTNNGGAIRSLSDGTLTIDDCIIQTNQTIGRFANGGAIFCAGDLVVKDSLIDNNVTQGRASGGGIYVLGNAQISSSKISRNLAREGGAGAIFTQQQVLIEDSVVEMNTAGGSGGGIATNGQVQLIRSTVANNKASFGGGGVFSQSSVIVKESEIRGNSSSGIHTGGGGIRGGEVLLIESQFAGNSAAGRFSGGGAVLAGDLEVIDCVITGNSTSGEHANGGGISARGSLILTRTTVSENFTSGESARGGGVAVEGDAVINESTIRNNQTSNELAFGGGIYSSGNLNLSHSIVSGNRTLGEASRGGGVFCSTYATLYRSELLNNVTYGEGALGGGLFVGPLSLPSNSGVTFVQSLVSGNSTHGNLSRGGGVYAQGFVRLEQTTLTSNGTLGSGSHGGGISVAMSLFAYQSTIANNYVIDASASGGGVWGVSPVVELIGSLVADNKAQNNTSDFMTVFRHYTVLHSLIGTNFGTNLAEAPVGSPDANGNTIGGAIHGVIDPMLGPLADNGGRTKTHAILPGSPAINTGEPTLVGGENGVPEFDQRGGPFTRVFGGRIDIGAFEAQSLIVDTLADENDGDYSAGDFSLREAIDLANRIVGENKIEFSASLARGTILLTMGELKITDHVQIVGLGADRLTVDARWMSRVIHVDGGMGTSLTPGAVDVVIQGLTIANGVAFSDPSIPVQTRSRGAGICFISSGHLNLDNVIVKGNRAIGSNATGAGVYVTRGITTVANSQFIENRSNNANNQPSGGAGIYSDNDVTVSDSVFSNNIGQAIHVTRNFGNSSVDILLLRTTISNNNGAAVVAEGIVPGTAQIVQSTINKNSRGGILTWAGPLTVTDSSITNNGSPEGSISGLSTGGDLTVVRSTVSGNHADGGGGLWGGGNIVVTDSFITNNYSNGGSWSERFGGGGILQPSYSNRSQTLIIRNSVISGNTSASHGGGIQTSGQVNILDSVINNNHAGYQGGGIFGGDGSNITLVRSTLDGNTAVGAREIGAGIYSFSDVNVNYTTISNNNKQVSAPVDRFGAGIMARNVTLLNATISGNGLGGIRARTIDARHSTIALNTGTGLYAPSISLDHTIVAGNVFSNQYESDVQAQNLQARYSQISMGAEYLGNLSGVGGPTRVHNLRPGSPAINAGDPNLRPGRNGAPEFDQRGAPYSRVENRVDIGAFEAQGGNGSLYGDFDLDGDIDGRDFLNWQRGFGMSGPVVGRQHGDATDDGDVDGNDLAVWQATYGPGWPPPRIVDFVLVVDEPAAMYAKDMEGATAALSSSAVSDVDAAFDDWPVQRRASADFGDMATRRKSLRTPRR